MAIEVPDRQERLRIPGLLGCCVFALLPGLWLASNTQAITRGARNDISSLRLSEAPRRPSRGPREASRKPPRGPQAAP
eukprot:7380520-Pyramimonas_sp.AAC.1